MFVTWKRHPQARLDPRGRIHGCSRPTSGPFAWLRTGLALVTFGFVLARIDAWLHGIALPDTAVHESPATAWIGAGFVA